MTLLTFNCAALPRETPLLLAGDLNLSPDSPALSVLRGGLGLADAMAGESVPSMRPPGAFRPRLPLPLRSARLDYVLSRGLALRGARYVLDDGAAVLSDHRGVLAEFHDA